MNLTESGGRLIRKASDRAVIPVISQRSGDPLVWGVGSTNFLFDHGHSRGTASQVYFNILHLCKNAKSIF